LLTTEKTTPKMARHSVIGIESMPAEIQCEAVHGTNPVHGELSTNRPADYIFKYDTNLCIKTKTVKEKNTQ